MSTKTIKFLFTIVLFVLGTSSFTFSHKPFIDSLRYKSVQANETGQLQQSQRAIELEKLGMIDVTDPPDSLEPAIGDGVFDDTGRLQAIIHYAFRGNTTNVNDKNQVSPLPNEGRLIVILPGDDSNPNTPFKGDYLVSDTLTLFQNSTQFERNGKLARSNVLIGSTKS